MIMLFKVEKLPVSYICPLIVVAIFHDGRGGGLGTMRFNSSEKLYKRVALLYRLHVVSTTPMVTFSDTISFLMFMSGKSPNGTVYYSSNVLSYEVTAN